MSEETTGPNRSLPTIEIISPRNPNKILRINEIDFDATKHVKADARFRETTEDERKILDGIADYYQKKIANLPISQQDPRDLEIARLKEELRIRKELASLPAPTAQPAAAEVAPETPKATPAKASKASAAKAPEADSLAGLKDL